MQEKIETVPEAEEEPNVGVNYKAEVEKSEEEGEGNPRFEPGNGKYKIRFVGEMNTYEKEYKGEVKKRAAVNILNLKDNKEYVIFMSQTLKKDTNFQKICLLAARNNNKLDGLEVEVLTTEKEINGNKYWDLVFPVLYDDEEPQDPVA